MKQNKSFLLKEIAGVPYLLPYGQMIADQKRGIQTNATGVWLWQLLEQEHSLEEILSLTATHYEISEEDLPAFREEITLFLQHLLDYDILESEFTSDTMSPDAVSTLLLNIAGLQLQLQGPEEYFPPDFTDFSSVTNDSKADLTILLHIGPAPLHKNGTVLLRDRELIVMELEEHYVLLFPETAQISEILLSKDGALAHCYCLPPSNDRLRNDLFHAIRLLFLYLAQKNGMVALHSASILYREKLWLFSGHSGMGKSTHTNLWKELYQTPVMNGDLNLLAIKDGTPVVHGIPWCGTSGIHTRNTYPLGGIILLNQAKENYIETLSPDKQQLLTLQRLISPVWTVELWNRNAEIIEKLSAHILICKLHCTKEAGAAAVIKEAIDRYYK